MSFSLKFEWDRAKAASNLRKHQISFEEATLVFSDSLALTIFDDEHSESEERWITIGTSNYRKLVVVVHTWVEDTGVVHVRLISARLATPNETRQYQG